MPTENIPLTSYSIRATKPGHRFGSPAKIPLRSGGAGDLRGLFRVPIDRVPLDATITSAKLRVWNATAESGSTAIRVYPNVEGWKSSVTWNSRPAAGTLIQTVTKTSPAANTMYEFDVTAWAITRSRQGLMLDSSGSANVPVWGSSAPSNKPQLVVTYTVPAEQPSALVPSGGAVSVAKPILAYSADTDMTQQTIQYSSDGTVGGVTHTVGPVSASSGYFDPNAAGAPTTPTLTAGQSTYWRVKTNGPNGESAWSEWAQYSYQPLPAVTITAPPATTDDGSPTLQWTVGSQTSWRAYLYNGDALVDSTPWTDSTSNRSWTPSGGVKVPDGTGRFELHVRDAVVPRVAATNADTWQVATKEFTTVLSGSGPAITNLAVAWDEPIPVITGTRSLGIPDQVALIRDGEIVPIWDADGVPRQWAPGADFFTGTNFSIRDYTASPRKTHTWSVITKTNGTLSAIGPSVTDVHTTRSVWIVDPRTGDRIEIFGNNGKPVVSQVTEEGSILHTPVHGALVVEPVRRRLMRTTRAGGVEGLVLNADEDTLEAWALSDSSLKYRLIFGKVNWSIIFGDYSPTDVFYNHPDPQCEDTLVLVSLNWWQRLAP